MAASQAIPPKRVRLNLKWIPPNPNYYKLNTDGSTSTNNDTNGIGGALIRGLNLAIQMQLTPLEVEIDAQEVTTLLATDNSKYANLFSDWRYLLTMLREPVVRHAYREPNGVADQLAKLGCRLQDVDTVQLQADKLGITRPRFIPITDTGQAFYHNRQSRFVSTQVTTAAVVTPVLPIPASIAATASRIAHMLALGTRPRV
ncbi:hypothetical protein A4A49_52376 [Nicotiana attenuata]|uniref:RNase H type-1 domain-containing protein n=1 Tax=Nicotiana attenuata TaxID=49451 RepID=A0A1J6KTB2_NICAT|nr:hypothetical protein A4A49_52376 [Nicotiana attenuata]